jgi:hypothetical protein
VCAPKAQVATYATEVASCAMFYATALQDTKDAPPTKARLGA